MTWYEIVKIIHIVAICMMVGATATNGLIHLRALKSSNPSYRVVALDNVMQINRSIMAPSFALIILSGFFMVYQNEWPLTSLWVWGSVLLTAILVVEFLVGFRLEKKLEDTAQEEVRKKLNTASPEYEHIFRRAAVTGSTATLFSLVIITLMVIKPV